MNRKYSPLLRLYDHPCLSLPLKTVSRIVGWVRHTHLHTNNLFTTFNYTEPLVFSNLSLLESPFFIYHRTVIPRFIHIGVLSLHRFFVPFPILKPYTTVCKYNENTTIVMRITRGAFSSRPLHLVCSFRLPLSL